MNALERAAATSRWATHNVGEKALLLIGLLFCAISLPPIPALPSIATILLVAAWRAGVPWRLYSALVAAPASFVALGLGPLIFAITPQGIVLIDAGPITAATVLARCIVGMMATMLFALTTPMAELFGWMHSVRFPTSTVYVTALTYRMISTLIVTSRSMWEAQAQRLGHSSMSRWIRSSAGLASSLFVVAFTRARRLGEGGELRGDPATMYNTLRVIRPVRWWYAGGYVLLLSAIIASSIVL